MVYSLCHDREPNKHSFVSQHVAKLKRGPQLLSNIFIASNLLGIILANFIDISDFTIHSEQAQNLAFWGLKNALRGLNYGGSD